MWLLDTEKIQLQRFAGPTDVPSGYAILSHVWGKDEQTFQDTPQSTTSSTHNVLRRVRDHAFRRPSAKIRNACARARHDGYRWLWADTCCIDKTNSSELSEAINSFYEWYRQASMCYVLLDDVPSGEETHAPDSAFRRSRYFKRCWTLQELIAPPSIIFLSKEWTTIGPKRLLASLLEEVTGIDKLVLTHKRSLNEVSVACRMSWAAGRQASRIEDEAYSLMGIFGVYMPTIYGEGKHAFVRLQEEILKTCPDQSIFAWGLLLDDYRSGTFVEGAKEHDYEPQSHVETLFASSPADFSGCADVRSIPHWDFAKRLGIRETVPEYVNTGFGVRTTFPVFDAAQTSPVDAKLALLACEDGQGQIISLYLRSHPRLSANPKFFVGGYIAQGQRRNHYYRGARIPITAQSYDKPARVTMQQPLPMEVHVHSQADRTGRVAVSAARSVTTTARSTSSMIFFEPPCTIVLSQRSVDRLREMGYAMPETVWRGFRLQEPGNYHTIGFIGPVSFTVHLGVCPLDRDSSSAQAAQLWAAVQFEGSEQPEASSDLVPNESMLVQGWKNATSRFGSKGREVRLMFSYPCAEPEAKQSMVEVYELDIRFEGYYRRGRGPPRRAATITTMSL